MQVIKLYPAGFAANTYLITENGREAVAIDPSQPRVLREAEKRGLQVTHVILTHGHFDHIGGVAALQERGAKVGCLAPEKELVLGKGNCAALFGVEVAPFCIDFTYAEGELDLDGLKIKVIATPGHTAGGASYLIGEHLFTGDTLFAGNIGRSDLPTGDGAALEKSVKKLYALEGDYTVHPGHDEDTTLGHERKYNGVVRE